MATRRDALRQILPNTLVVECHVHVRRLEGLNETGVFRDLFIRPSARVRDQSSSPVTTPGTMAGLPPAMERLGSPSSRLGSSRPRGHDISDRRKKDGEGQSHAVAVPTAGMRCRVPSETLFSSCTSRD
jgi:hypothetical protein